MNDIVTCPSPTEVRFSRLIAASLAWVWRAHTEPGHLGRWWAPEQKLVWSHGNFEEVLFHVTATFKAEGDGTRLETTMRLRSQAERDAQATHAVPDHESTMNKLETYLQQSFQQSATLKRD